MKQERNFVLVSLALAGVITAAAYSENQTFLGISVLAAVLWQVRFLFWLLLQGRR